jgi:hypothetical protein
MDARFELKGSRGLGPVALVGLFLKESELHLQNEQREAHETEALVSISRNILRNLIALYRIQGEELEMTKAEKSVLEATLVVNAANQELHQRSQNLSGLQKRMRE